MSEIAILEVYAGDRAPQFMLPKYSVYVFENTEIGHKYKNKY